MCQPVAPGGSGGASSPGRTFPVPSVALTASVVLPARARVRSARQRTDVSSPSGAAVASPRTAPRHVDPPSVLTSTRLIPRLPAFAIPAAVNGTPGRKFPMRDVPAGCVTHVTVERIHGKGPWREEAGEG